MQKKVIKNLTFIFLLAVGIFLNEVSAQVLNQVDNKTYLRWTLNVAKDQLAINTTGNTLKISSLNQTMIKDLLSDLERISLSRDYITSYKKIESSDLGQPLSILISLKDQSVEVFDFYQNETKNYVVDFWINQDLVSKEVSALKKEEVVKVIPPKKEVTSKKVPKKEVVKVVPKKEKKIEGPYRDFRYGASFIWDNQPMIPELVRDVNLKLKAPLYFYKVPNFILTDAKDEHMQLSLNFFNKKDWGLMTRSIDLYEKKYGRDKNNDINTYLKANALILNNIDSQDKSIFASAINYLEGITLRTKNSEMKVAILRYLTQYYLDKNDYIKALDSGKKLYVEASENLDDDLSRIAINTIVHSLAHLKQADKISEFLLNKTVKRLMPAQLSLAYFSFIDLEQNKEEEVIKSFEAKEKSLVRPIEAALLFNTAEAYFRNSNYERAISLFDEYIKDNSESLKAGEARVRLALSYEITNQDINKVILLYKDAINYSANPKVTYEAKLRMLGVELVRKREVTKKDEELYSFFDMNDNEKKNTTPELDKLKWLVRLRTLINSKKYEDALAYLQVLPLDSFPALQKNVFKADGAEAVFGRIIQAYRENNFSRAVRTWEVFKNKYKEKIDENPYLNFLVCNSYLNLGLVTSFDRNYEALQQKKSISKREFPLWVENNENYNVESMLLELQLSKSVRSEDYKGASLILNKISQNNFQKINYNFYKGLISFHLLRYTDTVEAFEKVFISDDESKELTAEQTVKMLSLYAESLYQLKDVSKFRKNVSAILQDLSKFKSKDATNVKERLSYLLVESYSSDTKKDYSRIEQLSKEFQNTFKSSPYLDRVNYLLGSAMIRNNKIDEGKGILNEIIEREETPKYIKDMARSELATYELGNNKI